MLDEQVLGEYSNWHLNNAIQKALRYRPEEARAELRAKAEAHRVRLALLAGVTSKHGR